MAKRKDSSADWRVYLAKRVHELVEKFGVEPFRAMVAEWQGEYAKKQQAFRNLQARRIQHFEQALKESSSRKRKKRPKESSLCDRTNRPGDGWEWCRECVMRDTEVKEPKSEYGTKEKLVFAWCPADLARIEEPRPLFPICVVEDEDLAEDSKTNSPPEPRTLTIPEKYTALVCVHDKYWLIGMPIIPRPANNPNQLWVDWHRLVGGHDVPDSDRPYLEIFLKEVRKQLQDGSKATELQKSIEDLPPNDTANLRPAYRRDHLWLKWHHQLYGKVRCINAEIRNRWNDLPEPNRKTISPRVPNTIGKGRSGAETVRMGIIRAKKELQATKSESVHRSAKKPRSRKII